MSNGCEKTGPGALNGLVGAVPTVVMVQGFARDGLPGILPP